MAQADGAEASKFPSHFGSRGTEAAKAAAPSLFRRIFTVVGAAAAAAVNAASGTDARTLEYLTVGPNHPDVRPLWTQTHARH